MTSACAVWVVQATQNTLNTVHRRRVWHQCAHEDDTSVVPLNGTASRNNCTDTVLRRTLLDIDVCASYPLGWNVGYSANNCIGFHQCELARNDSSGFRQKQTPCHTRGICTVYFHCELFFCDKPGHERSWTVCYKRCIQTVSVPNAFACVLVCHEKARAQWHQYYQLQNLLQNWSRSAENVQAPQNFLQIHITQHTFVHTYTHCTTKKQPKALLLAIARTIKQQAQLSHRKKGYRDITMFLRTAVFDERIYLLLSFGVYVWGDTFGISSQSSTLEKQDSWAAKRAYKHA